jgi:L-lysine exporter family protein LysE/ArgO
LAAAGKPLSRWLSSPRRWRLFDTLMALFMAWMAVVMAFKV